MPVIAFFGDIHGQIDAMYAHVARWQQRTGIALDALVQVGDFGLFLDERVRSDFPKYWLGEKAAPIPTFICPGNHEDISTVQRFDMAPLERMGVLPDGDIVEIRGVKIGAIWGNYSPVSWAHPERVEQARSNRYGGRVAMHIERNSVERLLRAPAEKMDVLITHDAASCAYPPGFSSSMSEDVKAQLGLDEQENPRGCPGFMQILDRYRPARYFFGHFHKRWESEAAGTRVTCLSSLDRDPAGVMEVVEF